MPADGCNFVRMERNEKKQPCTALIIYTRTQPLHTRIFFRGLLMTSSHPIQVHLKLHAIMQSIPFELVDQNILVDFLCLVFCFASFLVRLYSRRAAVKLVKKESNEEIMMMMMIWSRKRTS